MKLSKLHTVQRLPLSVEEAWGFFSNPHNLAAITPPDLGFRVTNEPAGRMYAGMIITYTVSPLGGVAIDWVTEITHVREPNFFVDEQRFGPYRFWHHQHHFREIDGGVEMEDIVHYAPPRPAATVLERLMIGPRLRRIFEFRREALTKRFGRIR